MRGKKKRRVSVRHISPRWSRVLSGGPLVGGTLCFVPLYLLSADPLPPPSTFPSSRVRFVCYERQLRRHASKQIRSYRLLRFVSSDLHVKGTLSCAFPRSLLHQLERAEIREMACRMAIRCSPTPICHDCSSSTMFIPENDIYSFQFDRYLAISSSFLLSNCYFRYDEHVVANNASSKATTN